MTYFMGRMVILLVDRPGPFIPSGLGGSEGLGLSLEFPGARWARWAPGGMVDSKNHDFFTKRFTD